MAGRRAPDHSGEAQRGTAIAETGSMRARSGALHGTLGTAVSTEHSSVATLIRSATYRAHNDVLKKPLIQRTRSFKGPGFFK